MATAVAWVISGFLAPKEYADWIATLYFKEQDAIWLIVIAALLVGIFFLCRRRRSIPRASKLFTYPGTVVVLLAFFVLAGGIVGGRAVFEGYAFTRDEVLAEFAADIYRQGSLVAPVAREWQPFAAALQPFFMLPVADNVAFVPGYLPVNAGLRAVVGLVADPRRTNPLLAALATLSLLGIGKRLWPDRPDATAVSAVLLATSSQVLVMSMTGFAMTAHLTLNLIWLCLFLRDNKFSHAGAIGIGFLACGLHQVIFHPLFAVPFLIRLWLRGRRKLAQIYALSYIYICIFWIMYPQLVANWYGLYWQDLPKEEYIYGSFLHFLLNVIMLLWRFNWINSTFLMLENTLRFVAWENPLLLPFVVLGYRTFRRREGIAIELFSGAMLTLIAMFILLPEQGTGWGYRYLHGLIGNFALLAGYGWIELSKRGARDEMVPVMKIFMGVSGFACLIMLPGHGLSVHEFLNPYIKAQAAIRQSPEDVVIVDKTGLLQAIVLVRNDPFLRDHPKILDLANIKEADIPGLCARYSIGLFDQSQASALGIRANDMFKSEYEALQRRREEMARLSCGRSVSIDTGHDGSPKH